MKKVILTAVLFIALPIALSFGFSDELEQYSFGHVIKVSSELIILSEVNYDSEDQDQIEVNYAIDSETIFENFRSISELTVDEEVEVSYVDENGQKKAKRIAKIPQADWDEELDVVEEESRV